MLPRSPMPMLLVFALTLFTSATLLFMVEPMIGKMITPLLGGTPAVWNTCIVFFQTVLLVGYGYAHLSTSWLGARKQAALHLVLLASPFLFLPLAVNRDLIKGDENPVFLVLLILSLSVGIPMFVVSASAPLLQKWFASTSHPAAKDPYFLYGASNLGSMLALVAYPTVVEPNLRLTDQSFDWSIGYGILVALTAACAVFLWMSPRNVENSDETSAVPAGDARASSGRSSEAIQPSKQAIVRGGKGGKRPAEKASAAASADVTASHTLTGEVTWKRVLRWVALAVVPSSLMLGATTYITTDIAAIPLLWVAPLALYLLSFIIVFSRVPGWVHSAMVVVMPFLVLVLLFIMLSDFNPALPWIRKHWITVKLALHLATLFVVSMVCHGELARDRPAAKYLTGYFLWMSVGGVLGGLFNALVAPVVFNGIVEYELAMMLACLLAPPLGAGKESSWGRRADVLLAGLFAVVGLVLLLLRLHDHDLPFDVLAGGPWRWQLAALLLGLLAGIVPALLARDKRFDRWLDVLLPVCLALLFVGLSWGLMANAILPRVRKLADMLHQSTYVLNRIATFGVPLVMCLTFVERSLRFALGVGAVMLASSFCGLLDDNVLHQERSFFGVLKVENEDEVFGDNKYSFRRLIHGTTLHGKQHLDEELRQEPLTYYHRSGPIGQVMEVYNQDGRRNLAVIGLGTGTMACYARPGQHLTFYDIDPVVRRLSFDEGKPYFTYVADARKRGAHLELVMGDARLTMKRKQLKDSEKYGLIVVDAFSSDAIPIHLLTREAMEVYLDKMTEDGLLAFHISNRYLDLRPVLANLAEDCRLTTIYQSDEHEHFPGKSSSTWVIMARKSEYLDGLRALNDWEDLQTQLLPLALWPDNGSGLAGQAWLLHRVLDEPSCKRPVVWKDLKPDDDDDRWPDPKKVGVWSDDYSNLLSVFWW